PRSSARGTSTPRTGCDPNGRRAALRFAIAFFKVPVRSRPALRSMTAGSRARAGNCVAPKALKIVGCAKDDHVANRTTRALEDPQRLIAGASFYRSIGRQKDERYPRIGRVEHGRFAEGLPQRVGALETGPVRREAARDVEMPDAVLLVPRAEVDLDPFGKVRLRLDVGEPAPLECFASEVAGREALPDGSSLKILVARSWTGPWIDRDPEWGRLVLGQSA